MTSLTRTSCVLIALTILVSGNSQIGAIQSSAKQARTIGYSGRPIPSELRPEDSHVVIVDARLLSGDGPLLALPDQPPKFPEWLRDASRTAETIALVEPVRIVGNLFHDSSYIKSVVDLKVIETLKTGRLVTPSGVIKTEQDGGTVTIDKTRVDLEPKHLELYKLGQRYLAFLEERSGKLTVGSSYLVLANGELRSLNRLAMPKGYEEPLDKRSLAEVSKLIRSFVK